MKIYRFSPITTEVELEEAWRYLVTQLEALSAKITGEKMPVTILKLFAHYPEEYQYLRKKLLEHGEPAEISSATSLYVPVHRMIAGQQISYLGVRTVDPYRAQVGCGDYEIEDYQGFADRWAGGKDGFVRDVTAGSGAPMIELWQPDFDVLGYVIRPLSTR